VLGLEADVTARSVAQTFRKILARTRWALTLARRWRPGQGGGAGAAALPVTAIGRTPSLASLGTGAVAAAGLDAPPASCGSAALGAAITGLGVSGQEPAFAIFQQTAPRSAGWLRHLPGATEMMK